MTFDANRINNRLLTLKNKNYCRWVLEGEKKKVYTKFQTYTPRFIASNLILIKTQLPSI
jgi:hypothetical protein